MKSMATLFGLLLALLTGVPTLTAAAQAPTVLFDQGHQQRFVIEENGPLHLSALAGAFRARGVAVRSSQGALSPSVLEGISALIVSGPFAPFNPEEIEAIVHFLQGGGRLAIMLHIGPPMAPFLHRLGVAVANGVVREAQGIIDAQPLNFEVSSLLPHPLTANLQHFSVFGTWPLRGIAPDVTDLARTGPDAWVDLDRNQQQTSQDAVQTFAIAVTGRLGAGEFVIFGDDAIFQNRFLTDYNQALTGNLVHWMAPVPPFEPLSL